jgi:hypothetical protein
MYLDTKVHLDAYRIYVFGMTNLLIESKQPSDIRRKAGRGTEETDPSPFVLFCPHETARQQRMTHERASTSRGVRFGVGASPSRATVSLPLRTRDSAPGTEPCGMGRGVRVREHWRSATTATLATFSHVAAWAWQQTWALSVVTARIVSIWGRGDRGRAAPCRVRVPGTLYRSRALHCTAPPGARAHKPPMNHIFVCVGTILLDIQWLVGASCVCMLLQISFSLAFRTTMSLTRGMTESKLNSISTHTSYHHEST